MSYFTKKVAKTYTFENDIVEVEMRRLKKKDAIKLAPKLGEPDEDGTFKLKFSDQVAFTGIAGEMLVKYVDSFTGLKDNDGTAISLEDACGEDSESYFLSLVSEIFSDLMDNSFSKGESEKKSVEESESISEGIGSIVTDASEE